MVWGDLWTYPFLASVWGTASSWFGVLGTVISIATAAYYYIRNQKLEEYAQARHVSFVRDVSNDDGFHVKVYNFSDESIFEVTPYQEGACSFREVLERDARKYVGHRVSDERVAELREEWESAPSGIFHGQSHDEGHIKPGENKTYVFEGKYSEAQDYSVSFRDAMARSWCLDLDSNEPHRMPDDGRPGSFRLRDRVRHPTNYARHLSEERQTRRWLDQHTLEEGR